MKFQLKMESCNKKILEELKALKIKFSRLKFDLAIIKNVSNILSSRLVELKREWKANSQYFRREILEVVDMSKSLSNDEVEGKACDILGKLGCNIAKDHLAACHWLKDKEITIKKFSKQKDCRKVLMVKN